MLESIDIELSPLKETEHFHFAHAAVKVSVAFLGDLLDGEEIIWRRLVHGSAEVGVGLEKLLLF